MRRTYVGLAAVAAGSLMLALGAPATGVEVPEPSAGFYVQTNGPGALITLGDQYTSTAGGNQRHLLTIRIPCGWPAGTPVHVDLYSPEMNDAAVSSGLSEEPNGARDTTTFRLQGPDGTDVSTSYPPVLGVAEQWVRLHTIADGRAACGAWQLTPSVATDDQNGWRLRVGNDADANLTTPPVDNPDGAPGSGDEIAIGLDRTTFQHDRGALTCQVFWSYVPPGQASARFHNFDMDGGANRVRYYPPSATFDPSGLTGGVAGTASPNGTWNGGSATVRGGDLVSNPETGWWRIVSCVSNHNQIIQEGISTPAGSSSLFYTPPGEPRLVVSKSDGVDRVVAGTTTTYDLTVSNTSDSTARPGAADDVRITDPLPTGTTFSSCVVVAPASGTCSLVAGQVVADLDGLLAAGASATVEVTVLVAAGVAGPIVNTATATYEDGYGNPYPPTSGTDTDQVDQPTNVWVTVGLEDTYSLDEPDAVLISFGNSSPIPADGVTLTGLLPPTFEPGAFDPAPGWTCTIGSGTYTCTHSGPMPPGHTGELRLTGTVRGPAGQTSDFPVEIATTTPELDLTDNDDLTSAMPRTLDVALTAVCVDDVPYVDYSVTPVAFTAGSGQPASLQWENADGDDVASDDTTGAQAMSGRLLWPGTVLDGSGEPIDWPGWQQSGLLWLPEDDGLRPTMTLTVSVNPTVSATVSYPLATAACDPNPTLAMPGPPPDPEPSPTPTVVPADPEPEQSEVSGRPVPTGTATGTPTGLAKTGGDQATTAVAGVLLILVGLLMVARRRPARV